ncbi:MAG: alpha/beta fold hydrolase [Gammaproteobacteria bacterium]|nr:alpha/beta fold hydrolase [Gammaproteobacteria bacterium]
MAVNLRTMSLLWLLVALAGPVQAGSAHMSLELASGLTAEADYWPGQSDRPVVLILHGFLQTRDFPTVRRLAESLADEGYSVLLPSLTLGLDRRRQGLACEAIHTHSMQQDVDELHAWVDWLRGHGRKRPVVVGHSAGGVPVAALLDRLTDVALGGAVLISLSYFGEEQGQAQLERLRARARADLAGNPDGLNRYTLSFCRDYVTGPAQLLSYLDWDREMLARALRAATVPVTLIYGDDDPRIDRDWLDGLDAGGVVVRRVSGAAHFFDLAHEFDLLDEVRAAIAGGGHG